MSLCYSVVLALLLPDTQLNARFLSSDQKDIAVERVRANHNVTSDRHFKLRRARPQDLAYISSLCPLPLDVSAP